MAALVEEHLEGLRGRSVYALAQQDSDKNGTRRPAVHADAEGERAAFTAVAGPAENPSFLRCVAGDLLLVAGKHHWSAGGQLIRATNQRTDSSGVVYRHSLLFLPTLSRPSEDELVPLATSQTKAAFCPLKKKNKL